MNGREVSWLYLLIAGLFEIGWIFSLKFTDGFTRLLPLLFYAIFGFGAAFFLSLALKAMPVGISYAIWVGIGIAGSNLLGIVLFGEPYKASRLFFVLLIIVGIGGLKWSSMK
jgi:quaternary ammonium compound-resistance protein SugE